MKYKHTIIKNQISMKRLHTTSFGNSPSKPRAYLSKKASFPPQLSGCSSISKKMLRYSKGRVNLFQSKDPHIVPKEPKETFNRVSHRYRQTLIYKKSVEACKGKKIGSSRRTNKTKSCIESISSISSLGQKKPKFYPPQKKVLEFEFSPSMESDTEVQQLERDLKSQESLELNNSSYNSELSIIVKPSENEFTSDELSTFDSLEELQKKNPIFKCQKNSERELNPHKIPLDLSEEEEEESDIQNEIDYKAHPNYHKFKHFETDVNDDEFMEIVINRLSKVKGDLSYKIFKNQFLPQHRKPTFSDYNRLRRCEIIMLKN